MRFAVGLTVADFLPEAGFFARTDPAADLTFVVLWPRTTCFETVFLALAAAFLAGALAIADFRAEAFPALSFALAAAFFTFAPRILPATGRATLTNPRIALTGLRTFAVAFTVGRDVALLREVAAMGSTLGTVET